MMTARQLIAELSRSVNLDAPAMILLRSDNVQHPVQAVNGTGPMSVEVEAEGPVPVKCITVYNPVHEPVVTVWGLEGEGYEELREELPRFVPSRLLNDPHSFTVREELRQRPALEA